MLFTTDALMPVNGSTLTSTAFTIHNHGRTKEKTPCMRGNIRIIHSREVTAGLALQLGELARADEQTASKRRMEKGSESGRIYCAGHRDCQFASRKLFDATVLWSHSLVQ